MSIKESLELRKKIKSRKPNYLREDHHKKKAVSKAWRKPRGRHSKMRHGFQGHRATLQVGYGSPKEVKNLHSSGLMPVLIHNVAELECIDKKKQVVLVSGTVGTRKKLEIVKKVKMLGARIINVKDIDAYINKIEDHFKEKKSKKEKAAKTKEEKKKEKEKKAEEKKKEAESPEDTKKKETKELEKVLTKREK